MMRASLILPLAAALGGCASSPTQFWTIEPVSARAPAAPVRAIAPIQVAAVRLPLALDRLAVVRHDEANRVRVLDFDRWSAPPGALMRTALTQDLVALLPAGSVIYPDAPAPAGTRRLVVDVIALQQVGTRYSMQLSWSIAAQPRRSGQLLLSASGTDDVAGQVQAISTMMGDLAEKVAAGL